MTYILLVVTTGEVKVMIKKRHIKAHEIFEVFLLTLDSKKNLMLI